MVRIVIVDDENASLNMMGRVISKIRDDIEIAGLFNTTQLVREFLENNHTDIIMSDIKMPGGDGIELAGYVHKNFPGIKMVFFSAYSDFEYAQQAIRLGVKHYLSKPIDIDELTATLNNLAEEVKKEKSLRADAQIREKKYNDLLLMAKTDLYTDILAGFLYNEDEISRRVKNLDMAEDETDVCHGVLMARCDDVSQFLDGRNGYYHMLSNLMREIECIADYISIVKLEREVVAVVRFNKNIRSGKARQSLEQELSALKETVLSDLDVDIEFEVAYVCESVYKLCDYKKMIDNEKLFELKFREMSSALFENDTEGAKKIFETIVCYARTLEISHAKKIFSGMFTYLEKSFSAYLSEESGIFNYTELWETNSLEDIVTFAKNAINKLQKERTVSVKGLENFTIELVKEYIGNNYMHDIVLEDIASYVKLSSFYLSKFFKSKTGQGISDYITRVRINAAKELMKAQKYKMYEISEMCGYKSRKYFTHAFKQHVGYTPSEYQRMIGCDPYGVGL